MPKNTNTPSSPRPRLNKCCPSGCDNAEEHKHAEFAEDVVSVWKPPTRIEPSGRERNSPHREHPPGPGEKCENKPRKRTEREKNQRDDRNMTGAGGTRAGQPRRTHSKIIRATNAVRIVIGVVHPNLQGHRHGERKHSAPGMPLARVDEQAPRARSECNGRDR